MMGTSGQQSLIYRGNFGPSRRAIQGVPSTNFEADVQNAPLSVQPMDPRTVEGRSSGASRKENKNEKNYKKEGAIGAETNPQSGIVSEVEEYSVQDTQGRIGVELFSSQSAVGQESIRGKNPGNEGAEQSLHEEREYAGQAKSSPVEPFPTYATMASTPPRVQGSGSRPAFLAQPYEQRRKSQRAASPSQYHDQRRGPPAGNTAVMTANEDAGDRSDSDSGHDE